MGSLTLDNLTAEAKRERGLVGNRRRYPSSRGREDFEILLCDLLDPFTGPMMNVLS